MNLKERRVDLISKDGKNFSHQEIFEEFARERFDETPELTNKTSFDDLIHYFKSDTTRKRFDDFENGIKLFENVISGDMKLEEAEKLQNVFKSNLIKISRERYKSKEQKSTLQNIKALESTKAREPVFNLFNDYSYSSL